MKRYLLLLFIAAFALIANAEKFRHLTTLDGLSQNDINFTFQDSKGFIWIGTNDGLNRYDGYNFKIFRKEPRQENGLVSNIVYTIAEDNNGNLWIGSSDNGISKFNPSTNKFTNYNNTPENPNVLHSNRIVRLVSDSYNNIWALTYDGLTVINANTDSIYNFPEKKLRFIGRPKKGKNLCKTIMEDEEGRIWLGTIFGLREIDPETYQVKVIPKGMRRSINVNNLIEYNNRLILCNLSRVVEFDKVSKQYKNLFDVNAGKFLVQDDNGNIYIGTNEGIVVCPRDKNGILQPSEVKVFKNNFSEDGLSNNFISHLYKDRSGLIWIGTNGGGVNIFNPKGNKFKHIRHTKSKGSLSYNKVRCLYEDSKGNFWVGTDGKGIDFLPASEKDNFETGFKHIDVNLNSRANRGYAMVEDTVNRMVWIGTGFPSNIRVFKVSKDKQVDLGDMGLSFNSSVFCATIDRDRNIWLGTYGAGIWRIRYEDGKVVSSQNFRMENRSYSLASNLIRSIVEDKQGNIWVGTSNGLAKIQNEDRNSDSISFFNYQNISNDINSLSHNYILPLFVSSKGDVWIGTMGGGLNRYRENEVGVGYFESYTTNDGLPNNVIKGIQEDEKGNLWISTNRGLTCFNPDDKSVYNYGIDDGLQDYDFSELASCKMKSGKLAFGGVNGINTFFPGDISEDTTMCRVAFTHIDILNQPINVGEEIRGRVLLEKDIDDVGNVKLKYAENSFTFYFTGLHFAAPHKNQYQYMLDGFDKDWIKTKSDARFAKYTNLKPGTYTLKVKASNGDGFWNDIPKIIDITVIAPWWMSSYAFALYVIVIIILLIFFRRFSLIGVQQKNQLLMERFEKEKVEELSKMKLRFFTNISHEFRTPLTLIIGPIEKLIKEKASLSEAKVDKVHETIYRNANVLLKLINQLMDFRKFEQGKMKMKVNEGNVVSFVQEIFNSFEILAEQKSIDYVFKTSSNNIKLWFDPEKLEKITFNLLSNAFKYTPDGGKISLSIEEVNAQVLIEVSDTGIGMSETTKEHVFERFFNAGKIDKHSAGSTGIGLSFTKSLVEMHHGIIGVESEEGVGTSFTVSLPMGNSHYKANEIFEEGEYQISKDVILSNIPTEKTKEIEEQVDSDSEEKLKLLVVEDNTELRSFISDSLREIYQVVEAGNGAVGLEKCKEENPDLIVSDVMMPEMDGFEMCEAIKQDVNISHIPIVLLTAKTSGEYKVKGYKLGADAYVSKPFEFDVLKAQIESLIAKRKEQINNFDKKIEISPSEITSTSTDEKFLAKIVSIIEENIDNSEFTVEQLADDYGISKVILNRKLKALTDKTAKIFIRNIRLKRAAQLLSIGRYTVAEVTYEVGFSDLKYFRTCFKNEFNLSPSEYKKEHTGEE